jgi:spore germination protein KB
MAVLGIVQYGSSVENFWFAVNVYPFYSLPFELVIPLLSLIVAIVRGLPKNKGGAVK